MRGWAVLGVMALTGGCSDEKSPSQAAGGAPSSGGAVSGGSGGKAVATGGAHNAAGGSGGARVGASGDGAGGKALDPSVLSEQPQGIDELKLDSTRVYWLEGHNRILSIPLAGGTPSVVYASTTPGAYEPLHIALDETKLYFTDQGARQPPKPRGVFSVPLDGSAERTLLITTSSIDQLTVEGGYVYFTADNCIARMSTSGGAPTALVCDIDTDTPLAVHAGYVYFWYAPDATVMQNVFRVPVSANAGPFLGANGSGGSGGSSGGSAGAPSIAAEQLSNTTRYSELILAPKVDGGYVYWSIYDELYRWPLAGGTQDNFGVLSSGSITMLLVDQGDVYWGGGNLMQFVVGGDSNTLVAPGLQDLSAFAVNETHIFFGDGKLLRRIPRP